ncbi:MAG: hypothetical protein NUW02_01840 [Candidatus Campbellbacteria bacterium]|nr:hypothetical protein [Candidatus Campbellbacteria bacterium]
MPISKSLKLSINISKQGKRYVAYSPALDIATSGKSKRDVQSKFMELVEIFFEEIEEKGTFEQVLTDLGWKKVRNVLQPPLVSHQTMNVRIPAFA